MRPDGSKSSPPKGRKPTESGWNGPKKWCSLDKANLANAGLETGLAWMFCPMIFNRSFHRRSLVVELWCQVIWDWQWFIWFWGNVYLIESFGSFWCSSLLDWYHAFASTKHWIVFLNWRKHDRGYHGRKSGLEAEVQEDAPCLSINQTCLTFHWFIMLGSNWGDVPCWLRDVDLDDPFTANGSHQDSWIGNVFNFGVFSVRYYYLLVSDLMELWNYVQNKFVSCIINNNNFKKPPLRILCSRGFHRTPCVLVVIMGMLLVACHRCFTRVLCVNGCQLVKVWRPISTVNQEVKFSWGSWCGGDVLHWGAEQGPQEGRGGDAPAVEGSEAQHASWTD